MTKGKEKDDEDTVCAGALPRKNTQGNNLQRLETTSNAHYNQSKLLPRGIFSFLSVLYQVKRHRDDKCAVGKMVFGFTLFIAFVYGGLDLTFTAFDVKSKKTKQTVTSACFVFLITLLWCSLGVYANRLCRRLLKSISFVNSVRLHSKTVFKIPAVLLIALFALVTIGISQYKAYEKFWVQDSACQAVALNIWVCRILYLIRCIQSLIVLLFNLCVAVAVLSICRTHTIGVRRFIKALENDGIACETKHRQRFMKMRFAASQNLASLYLPEQCYGEELTEDEQSSSEDDHILSDRTRLINGNSRSQNNGSSYGATVISQPLITPTESSPPFVIGSPDDTRSESTSTDDSDNPTGFQQQFTSQGQGREGKGKVGLYDWFLIPTYMKQVVTPGDMKLQAAMDSRVLSKDDIVFSYWKLASRMRSSSKALQRWMSTWITFTILWLIKWVITWVDRPATYFEIAQFIFPLLMLVILCTAYGETNVECERIISSITPLQDRFNMLCALPSVKVGMTIFNHPLVYGDILTVMTATGLALCSRLVLDELLPPESHD